MVIILCVDRPKGCEKRQPGLKKCHNNSEKRARSKEIHKKLYENAHLKHKVGAVLTLVNVYHTLYFSPLLVGVAVLGKGCVNADGLLVWNKTSCNRSLQLGCITQQIST